MTTIEYLLAYKYLAIFIGCIAEGPTVMAATGFLLKLGYFSIIPAFFALLLGDLVADIGWYAVGYYNWYGIINKFGNFIGFKKSVSDKITDLYHKHHEKILFFSKLSMGFGFALVVLVTAGRLRIPLKKYIAINFFAGLFWTGFMMALGYFFGNVYLLISEGLRAGFVIMVGILFLLAIFGMGRFIRAQFLKRNGI